MARPYGGAPLQPGAVNTQNGGLMSFLNNAFFGNYDKRMTEARNISPVAAEVAAAVASDGKPSMYGNPIPLGDPNGTILSGENFNRINEVGDTVYPIPSSGIRNQAAVAPVLTPTTRGSVNSDAALKYAAMQEDNYETGYSQPVVPVAKPTVTAKPKSAATKKRNRKAGAKQAAVTKKVNKVQDAINSAAGVASGPTHADRLAFMNTGVMPRGLSAEQDRILSMF